MRKVTVDHARALATLEQAATESVTTGFRPHSKLMDAVKEIVCGGHLTYRYILATGLLAKAVEPTVNALALQAGAKTSGAYDARSLCHKVIVPHEGRLLDNGLGGSNEPYLNKPARFKILSLHNPVRAGTDKRTLITLHVALSSLKSSDEAFAALCDLVYFARKQKAAQAAVMREVALKAVGSRPEIIRFLSRLVSDSHHGETAALAAAVLFWILGSSRHQEWRVHVHPVNESGASSNEVGDIDVYAGDERIIVAEVKDKTFRLHDVEHAVDKANAAGHRTLYFIRGPQGVLSSSSDRELVNMAAEKDIELLMLNLGCWITDAVSFAESSLTLKEVADQVGRYAVQARCKKETVDQIVDALQS